MIRYALTCDKGHAFESWFQNSAAYDKQVKRGLVTCPVCGSTKVEKAIMAPRLLGAAKKRGEAPAPLPSTEAPPSPAAAPEAAAPVAMVSPQEREFRKKLKELREHLTKNADYVGQKFPEEARKMHYGEIEHRSIYGEASPEEAKELHEEGIEFHPLPVLPGRAELNDLLQLSRTHDHSSSHPDHDQHDAERFARRRRLLEHETRDRLREQHLDQRQRAHAGGRGERKCEKPELRGERAHEAREQRRPPGPHDRDEHGGIAQPKIEREQHRLQQQAHDQREGRGHHDSSAGPSSGSRRESRRRRARTSRRRPSPSSVALTSDRRARLERHGDDAGGGDQDRGRHGGRHRRRRGKPGRTAPPAPARS